MLAQLKSSKIRVLIWFLTTFFMRSEYLKPILK